jgi:hypothetical protein
MPYDRDKAIAYAQTFWTAPCKDGLLGTDYGYPTIESFRRRLHAPAPDWDALFVRDNGTETGVFRKAGEKDKPFQTQDALEDCAHYLSQCVRAGGAGIDTQWGVRELVGALQGLANTKTLMERGDATAGARIMKSGIFKKGDMIGYFHNDRSLGKYGYGHSAMYVGDGGITCHSTCRYKGRGDSSDDDWDLSGRDYTYTFMHFSDDDPAPNPANTKALAGWWQLDYSSRTEYYLMTTGWATYTKRAPRKGQTAVYTPEGSAYWFMAASREVTFTWRNTGTVEVWTPQSGGGYSSKINGVIPGKLTKLF